MNYYAQNKGLLGLPRREINESVLFDEEAIEQAKRYLRIGELVRQINETKLWWGVLLHKKLHWNLGLLRIFRWNTREKRVCGDFRRGSIDLKNRWHLSAILASDLPAIADVIHSDNEQSYVVLVSYKDAQEDALTILKARDSRRPCLKICTAPLRDNINRLDQETNSGRKFITPLKQNRDAGTA